MRPIDSLLNDYWDADLSDPATAQALSEAVDRVILLPLRQAIKEIPIHERTEYLKHFQYERLQAQLIRQDCKRGKRRE